MSFGAIQARAQRERCTSAHKTSVPPYAARRRRAAWVILGRAAQISSSKAPPGLLEKLVQSANSAVGCTPDSSVGDGWHVPEPAAKGVVACPVISTPIAGGSERATH